MSNALPRFIALLADHTGAQQTTVGRATRFDSLAMDSLDRIELMMIVEEEFGVAVDDEAARGIQTVGEAVDMIDQLCAKAAAP